ncbi:MAG: MFS transporter [Actinomycetia bacterium]|nr:MFS transporter [Actinomycetes bacterium]
MTAIDDQERAALQRRTLRTLMVGVLPAGAAMAAGYSAAALLGKDITGNAALGTLAAACLTIGGTFSTIPLARYMARKGRRAGMRMAWSFGFVGATIAFLAAVLDFYPFLIIGIIGIGIGQAANLAARYAAADLAVEEARAKSIGWLVWAGAWGSALGPTLGLGVVGNAADQIGLPKLAGPYLMGMVLFAAAAIWMDRKLRPDPLEVVGGLETSEDSTGTSGLQLVIEHLVKTTRPLGEIFRHPSARLAVLGMLIGQAVMVAVMTATPLHMDDGDHEVQIIGFVISVHIIGMYFFAPIVGILVDRIGPRPLIAAGGIVLFLGSELASHTEAQHSMGVFSGLFLIGVGWSFGLVAGSSLLTGSFPIEKRVTMQGSADLIMSGAGAIAGLSSGVVYEISSYHALSHYAGIAALGLTAYAIWRISRVGFSSRPSAMART